MAVFSFEIDNRYITHIKEKSSYNNNFYKLDLNAHGDYFGYCKCDILREKCDEFSETYEYCLGYFEDDKFQEMFSWTEMECKTI